MVKPTEWLPTLKLVMVRGVKPLLIASTRMLAPVGVVIPRIAPFGVGVGDEVGVGETLRGTRIACSAKYWPGERSTFFCQS